MKNLLKQQEERRKKEVKELTAQIQEQVDAAKKAKEDEVGVSCVPCVLSSCSLYRIVHIVCGEVGPADHFLSARVMLISCTPQRAMHVYRKAPVDLWFHSFPVQ